MRDPPPPGEGENNPFRASISFHLPLEGGGREQSEREGVKPAVPLSPNNDHDPKPDRHFRSSVISTGGPLRIV
jgi:hypothetical protein